MHLSPGVILVSSESQQRLGWLPILLSAIDQTANASPRLALFQQELFERCGTFVHPFVTQWLADEYLIDKSSSWNRAAFDKGLHWLRSLGLLTPEGYSLTSLGRVWLDVWFQDGALSDNPLLLRNPIRRLVAWTTLLNADGLLLLSTVKALSSAPQSLKQLHSSLDNTLKTNVWFSRVHSGPQHLKRLQKALPNLFNCRLKPLVELGVVSPGDTSTYSLTDLGKQIKVTVSEWSLDDEDTLKRLPIECAWQLAQLGTDCTDLSSDHLASHLLQWIQRVGSRVWRLTAPPDTILGVQGNQTSIALSHWPLWESLLLAACESILETNRGFELVTARRVLDALNQREPGLIRWIEDRERREQLFQLQPEIQLAVSQSQPERSPTDVVRKGMVSEEKHAVSPQPHQYSHDGTVAPSILIQEPILSENQITHYGVVSASDTGPVTYSPLWLDLLEDELLSEERRPGRIPLLGALSTLQHLKRRLHSIYNNSEGDQDTRFWNRLDSGEEWAQRLRIEQSGVCKQILESEAQYPTGGLYGGLLSRLTCTWLEFKSVATLREFLLYYRPGKRERHSQALARIEYAFQELSSKQRFLTPDVESLERAQLSVRDALIAGHITRDWIAAHHTGHSTIFLDSITPKQRSLFEYSGALALPNELFELLRTVRPNRSLRIQDSETNWIEATIPAEAISSRGDAEKTPDKESPQLLFTGSINAESRKIAKEQAASFVARLHDICVLGLTKAKPLDDTTYSIKECNAKEDVSHPQPVSMEQDSMLGGACIHWRPDLDNTLLRLAVEGVHHDALKRTLAAWRRSIGASSVRSQFTELWSALEHLVGPTGGLGFTRRLAELITPRMLNRRLAALIEELAQRGLRSTAVLPEQHDESARALYECIEQLCVQDGITFKSNFPFDAQRCNPEARVRHVGLTLKLPLDFATALQQAELEETVTRIVQTTKLWLPSLHQCLVEWRDALLDRRKLFGLLIREHDHIVQTYGLIYDLRNRIQHEDDPFDGTDESLLEIATDYLRTWWRVLIEGLLELKPEPQYPLTAYINRLKHPLEDLAFGFRDVNELMKKPPLRPSAHELRLVLGIR